jgi:serine/threonine-protein kinase
MKTLQTLVLVVVLSGVAFLGLTPAARSDVVYFSGSTYAAIAYSPSTGKIGYGYNYGSRSEAQAAALRNCPASDARIVTWVNNGFCAFALGDDKSRWGVGWSYGNGATNTSARSRALYEARKRTVNCHVVLCVCSTSAVAPER